jgi:Zn-dependent peptidase ImmA (M78 family)
MYYPIEGPDVSTSDAAAAVSLMEGSARAGALAAELAETFAVSRQAAAVRIQTLNLVPAAGACQLPAT